MLAAELWSKLNAALSLDQHRHYLSIDRIVCVTQQAQVDFLIIQTYLDGFQLHCKLEQYVPKVAVRRQINKSNSNVYWIYHWLLLIPIDTTSIE